MKKIMAFLWIFSCALVSAQEDIALNDSTPETWSFAKAEKMIKLAPFEIISIVPTFGADLEVVMDTTLSLQAGAGIIIPYFQTMTGGANDPFDRLGGYKLRAESRFFLFKKPNRYLATELSLRHLIIQDEVGIGMEPSSQPGQWGAPVQTFAYFVNTDMTFHRFTTALNVKYGIQKVYAGGAVVDFYTGLSIRRNHTRTWSEIPAGGTIPDITAGPGWRLGDRISGGYITPIIGLRIGFVL